MQMKFQLVTHFFRLRYRFSHPCSLMLVCGVCWSDPVFQLKSNGAAELFLIANSTLAAEKQRKIFWKSCSFGANVYLFESLLSLFFVGWQHEEPKRTQFGGDVMTVYWILSFTGAFPLALTQALACWRWRTGSSIREWGIMNNRMAAVALFSMQGDKLDKLFNDNGNRWILKTKTMSFDGAFGARVTRLKPATSDN